MQLSERIWNVMCVGEVTLLQLFSINGVDLVLSLHQLVDGNGVLLEGRVRVWNAIVRGVCVAVNTSPGLRFLRLAGGVLVIT